MSRGRAWSDEDRTNAIELVREHGLAHAWRETGIPKPTLVLWCQKVGVERYRPEQTRAALGVLEDRAAQTRATLRLMLLEKAVDLIERMDAPHVEFKGKDADQVEYPIAPASAVQNYATSAAILIDKYRLEVGEATGREERWTNDFADHEARDIADAIRADLARRADADLAARAEPTAVGGDSPEGATGTGG